MTVAGETASARGGSLSAPRRPFAWSGMVVLRRREAVCTNAVPYAVIVRDKGAGVAVCISSRDATFDVPHSRHIDRPGTSPTDSGSVAAPRVRRCLQGDEQTGETKRREGDAAEDGVVHRMRLSERSRVGGLAGVPRRRSRVRRAAGARVLLSRVRGGRIRARLNETGGSARSPRRRRLLESARPRLPTTASSSAFVPTAKGQGVRTKSGAPCARHRASRA